MWEKPCFFDLLRNIQYVVVVDVVVPVPVVVVVVVVVDDVESAATGEGKGAERKRKKIEKKSMAAAGGDLSSIALLLLPIFRSDSGQRFWAFLGPM